MPPTNEFEDRLRRAVERGTRRREDRAEADRQVALTESEFKARHTSYRLLLSEQIETTLKRIPDHLPGFRYELVYGERGWGAAVGRDDYVSGDSGKRMNRFSRLEMTVRPYSEFHVLELTAKGTIRDKELFSRSHFEPLTEAEPSTFSELIDTWAVEFAEMYSARA